MKQLNFLFKMIIKSDDFKYSENEIKNEDMPDK